MKIYVAGASREVNDIVPFITALRQAGHEITFDWTREVLEYQRTATSTKTPLTTEKRLECALADANGVLDCDLLWVCCPQPESHSVGCWTELGIAIGASGCGRTKQVVVSGQWRRSPHTEYIFTELSHPQFDTHEEALSYLCALTKTEVAEAPHG